MSAPWTLTLAEAGAIAEAVQYRQDNWSGESLLHSVMVVLLNAGSEYVPVRCVGGEWSGTKGDLAPADGIPMCPNEHVLLETGPGKRLGFIDDTEATP